MSGLVGHRGLLLNKSALAPCPLDAYTSNLWSACALTQLLSSYTGPLITVRRSSDNTTIDIGSVSEAIDTASLLSFVGSGDGFILKVFDQSGQGNSFEQSTSTAQSMIVSAGSYLGLMSFNGTSDCLVSTNNNDASKTALTIFAKKRWRNLSGTYVAFEHSSNQSSADGAAIYSGSSTMDVSIHSQASNGYSDMQFAGTTSEKVFGYRLDRTQASNALQSVMFQNGIKQSATSNQSIGGLPNGDFASTKFYLGARAASSLFCPLDVKSLVIYQIAATDSEMSAVSGALA